MTRTKSPRKNCGICNGRGYLLYADSFDKDNWSPCHRCKRAARLVKAKLAIMYPGGLSLV